MNAHLAAGLAVLEELYDVLAELIQNSDDDALNWTPPVAAGNSIAALTRHIAGSNDAWFKRALGQTFHRDRDAEFHYHATKGELLQVIAQSRITARDQLERIDTLDPAAVIRYRRLGATEESVLSLAWCVEHALIHAGEHWGEIQLNRQLFAAQG